MDNNKFEDIIKKEIKKEIVLPDSVQAKINEAYRKIERDRMEKDMKKFKIVRKFIEITTLLFVGGNVVAYAANKPNVISYVIDKLNIGSSYEEYSENINITKESNGVKITIKDVAIDSNMMAIGYNVKFDRKIDKETISLDADNRVISNGYDYNLDGKQVQEVTYRISDNEFEVYTFYKIYAGDFNDDIKVISKIINTSAYTEVYMEGDVSIKGEWNFEFDFKRNEHKLGYKKYKVNNAQLSFKDDVNTKVKVTEMEFSEIGTIITFDPEYTDPDRNYTAEIRDGSGNIILEKGAQPSYDKIIVKNLDLNDKITITMYENVYDKNDNIKVISTSTEIDLSKQLESEEEKIDKKYKDIVFGKMTLNIPDSWTTEDDTLGGLIVSKKNNDDGYEFLINKYNLSGTLEERYEILKTHDKASWEYQENGIYTVITGETEESEKEYKLTYDEFKKAIDGGKVTKDGYTITHKNFGDFIDEYEVISKENIKIDGMDVIKYISRQPHKDTMIHYVIGKDNETYEISIEQNSENRDIIDNIIKNIKINK